MRGRQTYGETTADYWEGFEPLRKLFDRERKNTGLTTEELVRLAGVSTLTHWWSKSQWEFPNENTYRKLQEALRANGLDGFRQGYDELRQEFYKTRAFFDNTHATMSDVWSFNRSVELREESMGHPTPKPIPLCERAIKSSSRVGDIVLDMFGGSGSTLIACENLGRSCRMMELEPSWCNAIITRWEHFTGQKARRKGSEELTQK